MCVTSDNHTENINTIRGQNSRIFNVKACGTQSNVTAVLQRVNMLTSIPIVFSKMIPFNTFKKIEYFFISPTRSPRPDLEL
jgi:hypothetical protein